MIWLYAIAAILLFSIALAVAFLIALRFCDWEDSQADYDADNQGARGKPDAR